MIPTDTIKYRIRSIDTLRGLIMLIMALDHVRDFFSDTALTADPTNLASTTTALFFTRWITHFCAPVFVFLSGISAYLSGQKKSLKEQSLFLIKRGIWLILVEITIVTFGLTFNPFFSLVILQVIWAIGWSMVLLGLILRVSTNAIAIVGAILFFGHNLLNYFSFPDDSSTTILLKFLATSTTNVYPLAPGHFILLSYTILPFTGIMFLGYAIGKWFESGHSVLDRKKKLLYSGIGVTVLFILLRFINKYGDLNPWSEQPDPIFTLLSFLNVSKYPPSLQFGCMTIGPALILLSFWESLENKFTQFLSVYGKVPFFYYILHFYLIHFLCVIGFFATGHGMEQIADPNSPFLFRPPDFGFSLPIVYLIWLTVILIMYFPCRWFVRYKKEHQNWWIHYL